MRATIAIGTTLTLATLAWAGSATAQELGDREREAAVRRARAMAGCVERSHREMQRLMRLLGQAEAQRDGAGDPSARRDAVRAIEALLTRMADAQREARECLGGEPLPAVGTRLVERWPPPDPAADAVAADGDSIRTVERDARLAAGVRVVRALQVDGEGRLEAAVVRAAIRGVGPRLARCYERYLERGSAEPRSLDLVFGFRAGSRAARAVAVERSAFSDPGFERCVRSAGQRIHASRPPAGGEALFSYTLRFEPGP